LQQLKKIKTAHQTPYQILLLIITSRNIRKQFKKISIANTQTPNRFGDTSDHKSKRKKHIRNQKGSSKLNDNNVPFGAPITNAKEALEQVEKQRTKVCTPTITNESMQIPDPVTHEFMKKYPFLKKDPFSKKTPKYLKQRVSTIILTRRICYCYRHCSSKQSHRHKQPTFKRT
jgi:hypothetical protein